MVAFWSSDTKTPGGEGCFAPDGNIIQYLGPRSTAFHAPPACFAEDFFSVLGDDRPDHQWLIIGPERSGSKLWSSDTKTPGGEGCFAPDGNIIQYLGPRSTAFHRHSALQNGYWDSMPMHAGLRAVWKGSAARVRFYTSDTKTPGGEGCFAPDGNIIQYLGPRSTAFHALVDTGLQRASPKTSSPCSVTTALIISG
jgi:roadblock/LC7 domain-containing protein